MPATREQRSHRHIVSPRRTAQRLEQRTTQRGSSTRRGLQFLRIDGTKARRRRPLSERAGCTGGARSPAGPPELRSIRTGIQYRMPILQDDSGGRRRGRQSNKQTGTATRCVPRYSAATATRSHTRSLSQASVSPLDYMRAS